MYLNSIYFHMVIYFYYQAAPALNGNSINQICPFRIYFYYHIRGFYLKGTCVCYIIY